MTKAKRGGPSVRSPNDRRKSSAATRALKDKLSAKGMDTAATRLCATVYTGPSVPDARGVQCHLPAGHDRGPPHGAARHWAMFKGIPIGWYTREQKAARMAEPNR